MQEVLSVSRCLGVPWRVVQMPPPCPVSPAVGSNGRLCLKLSDELDLKSSSREHGTDRAGNAALIADL